MSAAVLDEEGAGFLAGCSANTVSKQQGEHQLEADVYKLAHLMKQHF